MKSPSPTIFIETPAAISSSAFRCLELFSLPLVRRKSWSPTTKIVVRLLPMSATWQPILAAALAASARVMFSRPVNTTVSPAKGPEGSAAVATPLVSPRSLRGRECSSRHHRRACPQRNVGPRLAEDRNSTSLPPIARCCRRALPCAQNKSTVQKTPPASFKFSAVASC